jgi:hypothetical protein
LKGISSCFEESVRREGKKQSHAQKLYDHNVWSHFTTYIATISEAIRKAYKIENCKL